MIHDVIQTNPVIAIIRKVPFDKLPRLAQALADGGIKLAEITMDSEKALEGIQVLKERQLTVGAGTVLDAETARLAILHGAEFLITPCVRLDVIATGRRYNVPVMTGAFTPTEILQAYEAGSDYVKVFPAANLGPSYIKDVKGPLSQIPLIPTGGVNIENIGSFLQSGATAVGVGGSLIDKKRIEADDFATIEKWSRELVAAAKG